MYFHFYNLQPLVVIDNLMKGYIDTFTDAVKVEDKKDFILWIRRNKKRLSN
jgi:hypothetical protein